MDCLSINLLSTSKMNWISAIGGLAVSKKMKQDVFLVVNFVSMRLNRQFYLFFHSGMIDSPAGNQETMDRGYDFPGVVGKSLRQVTSMKSQEPIVLTMSLPCLCVLLKVGSRNELISC